MLQRENKEKCREVDQLKRLTQRLKDDLEMCRAGLEERDRLIQVSLLSGVLQSGRAAHLLSRLGVIGCVGSDFAGTRFGDCW